ncbi:glycoside hydrolase family 27 protein [Nocardia stercoris]|uniref:Alpha-galactosidase n=2 Tax=Nocardia stercoris TaxID=2483361 RepID=A0A3M2LGF9_9NOCA|nr:glycoside hydrolase family 27 protein [Nocardia stercoris]
MTPPMGWNSWNSGIALTEQNVEQTADAMVASGMRDAGYRYVNLDAGWAAPRRDAAGNLTADPRRFPHGIAALAAYVHERGLRLGLYSSPYNQVCGQDPGTAGAGHEDADARTFASWGVDYLKYDWCSTDADYGHKVRDFTAMRDALRRTGRQIVYSINPNSSAEPTAGIDHDWTAVADLSRNTGDLIPVWHNSSPNTAAAGFPSSVFLGVIDQFAKAGRIAQRSSPTHINDPDMTVVGLPFTDFFAVHLAGVADAAPEQLTQTAAARTLPPDLRALLADPRAALTPDEERAHFSLWAMLAAPLIAGNDLRTMSPDTRAVLTNADVVAVDQDPLVVQATPLAGDDRVLVKKLADGSLAVALLNRDAAPADLGTTIAALGLPGARTYTVRDLWTHDSVTTADRIDAPAVPAHGVRLLRITAS